MVGTSQHETNLVYQINNKKSYIDVFAHLDILRLSAWEVGVLSLRGQAVGGSLPMMSKYHGVVRRTGFPFFVEAELHGKARTGDEKWERRTWSGTGGVRKLHGKNA
jgi:hypothetical protein